ncbi:homeodomain-interacting protein kinase 1-like [Antennarius striatus]|uniref:homeodomain-interacting protein kinase 1-like n=1 Tax=Antennarius striatus TaxID=241820 RepID=UPI0035AEA912
MKRLTVREAVAAEIRRGHHLYSKNNHFTVQRLLGEGRFGKVHMCLNMETKERLAVKILSPEKGRRQRQREFKMLKLLKTLNPDQSNILRFIDQFDHRGNTCQIFELLDKSLFCLIKEQNWRPLSLNEIRPIAQQLFVALDSLKGLGVIHTDIKLDNIMLVNSRKQPLRVKLIDFGEAVKRSEVQSGMIMQACGYRAPEVSLGLPISEAIDVWSVGCVLTNIYLIQDLFATCCTFQMMKDIVSVVGQPEEGLLSAGAYTRSYFKKVQFAASAKWRLMTPDQYRAANGIEVIPQDKRTKRFKSLDGLVHVYPEYSSAEFHDRRAFVNLLKRLLHVDATKRLCPRKALQHPFVSTVHLTEMPKFKAYLTAARAMMGVCWTDGPTPLLENDVVAVEAPAPEVLVTPEAPPAPTSTRSFKGRIKRTICPFVRR